MTNKEIIEMCAYYAAQYIEYPSPNMTIEEYIIFCMEDITND
jgi:hypothetical protein